MASPNLVALASNCNGTKPIHVSAGGALNKVELTSISLYESYNYYSGYYDEYGNYNNNYDVADPSDFTTTVDWGDGTLLRDGKAAISSEVADIFARLGSTPETWGVRMAKLTGGRLLGRFLVASRERLRQLASKLQVRHLVNVG